MIMEGESDVMGQKPELPKHLRERAEHFKSRQRSRIKSYRDSNLFINELAALDAKLKNSKQNATRIAAFIGWFDPYKHGALAISRRISRYSDELQSLLEDYVGFVFRFRVRLTARVSDDKKLLLKRNHEVISGDILAGRLHRGKLGPTKTGFDRHDDYRDALESTDGETPEYVTQLNEDQGFRFLTVKMNTYSRRTGAPQPYSDLFAIVDTFYDPVKLNFVIIERGISPHRVQRYLVCLAGELSSANDWKRASAVRTRMIKHLYQASTRGRRANRRNRLDDMAALEKHGYNVKAGAAEALSTRLVNEMDASVEHRLRERMRRACNAAKKKAAVSR
jgi:hypothetical protein